VWYRYAVQVPGDAAPLVRRLAELGVHAARPVEPWVDAIPAVGAEAYRSLLSLPLFPTLTRAEQDRVVQALGAALETGGCA
jgi:dTDP-4-amino-4,6-dideoxygalactose transaminase